MSADPRRTTALLGAALALALPPARASATSLNDAIRLAYETNPSIRAARLEQQAVGESYVQARAGLGPQVNFQGAGEYLVSRVQSAASEFGPAADTTYRGGSGTADLSIVQPIFNSGASQAQIRGVADQVRAGGQSLRQSEENLLERVIAAYLDVRRDRAILSILNDEIANLSRDFQEIQARGQLGELTKTDIAEAKAQMLSAEAQLDSARARLLTSNAEYLAVVGENPDELAPEPALSGLPASVDEAFTAADKNNPQILQTMESERAAREQVNAAKAAYGPTVSLRVDAGASPIEPYIPNLYDRSVTVSAVVNQPLFTSGLRASRVRQAADRDGEAMLQIEATRRGVVQTIAQAWAQLTSTRKIRVLAEQQVDAQQVAAEGNLIEERVGRRSTFELLNMEAALASARTQLAQDKHDEYLSQAAVLAAMGLLEPDLVGPGPKVVAKSRTTVFPTQRDATPWQGAIEKLDGALGPHTAPPAVGPPGAGSERPVTTAPGGGQ
jgi:outer membrane protein